MATPAIITTVSAAILGYIGIASLCSATKVNVLAPTLIGGGASILYPHSTLETTAAEAGPALGCFLLQLSP